MPSRDPATDAQSDVGWVDDVANPRDPSSSIWKSPDPTTVSFTPARPDGNLNYAEWFRHTESHIRTVLNDPDFQDADIALARQRRTDMGPAPELLEPKILHYHKDPDMSRQGAGLQLYFLQKRDLAILFFILGLLKLPQIIYTSFGDMLKLQGINKTLLGNLGTDSGTEDDTESAAESAGLIRDRVLYTGDHRWRVGSLVVCFGVLDVICSLVVVAFMWYFIRYRTPQVKRRSDALAHSLGDHSIMVSRLPARLGRGSQEAHHRYRRELQQHFEGIARANPDHQSLWGSKTTFDPVTEVVLVRDSVQNIADMLQLGKLKEELALLEAKRLRGVTTAQTKVDKILTEIDKLTDKLILIDTRHSKDLPVSLAFISFKFPSDKEFIVQKYAGSRLWLLEASQPPNLRFHNHPLAVESAPEPEDIIWEHVTFPVRQRIRNICLIWLLLFILLAGAFFLTAVIERLGGAEHPAPNAAARAWHIRPVVAETEGQVDWSICDVHFFADTGCTSEIRPLTLKPTLSNGTETMVNSTNDEGMNCADPNSIWQSQSIPDLKNIGLAIKFSEPTKVQCVQFKQSLDGFETTSTVAPSHGAASDKNFVDLLACEDLALIQNDTTAMCTRVRHSQPEQNPDLVNTWKLTQWNQLTTSYCQDISLDLNWDEIGDSLLANGNRLDNAEWYLSCYCLDDFSFSRMGICTPYYAEYFKRNFATWLILIVVAVFNSLIKALIKWLVWRWERPWSYTQKMTLSFSKVFVAQYLNSGFNILLSTGSIFPRPIMIANKSVTGSYGDFSGGWYEAAGGRLMTFGWFHIFFPHVLLLALYPLRYLWRKFRSNYTKLQIEADRLYAKGDFGIDTSLAASTALACFMLTYSGPIPLMPFCGCLAMIVLYWKDKFHLVYESRRPPQYTVMLTNVATAMLQVGLMIRALISMSAFGHPLVSPSCSLGSGSSAFLNLIVDSAESEGAQLTYLYVPPDSSALDPDWAPARLKSYILSCASFPSTLYIIVEIFAIVVVVVIVCFFTFGPTHHVNRFARWVLSWLMYVENPVVEDETYEECVKALGSHGYISSYKMRANPAYDLIQSAQAELRKKFLASRLGKMDSHGHIIDGPVLINVTAEGKVTEVTASEIANGFLDDESSSDEAIKLTPKKDLVGRIASP